MPKLPRITARLMAALLEKVGFSLTRQSGSHQIHGNAAGRLRESGNRQKRQRQKHCQKTPHLNHTVVFSSLQDACKTRRCKHRRFYIATTVEPCKIE
jgi:hypothetical protein